MDCTWPVCAWEPHSRTCLYSPAPLSLSSRYWKPRYPGYCEQTHLEQKAARLRAGGTATGPETPGAAGPAAPATHAPEQTRKEPTALLPQPRAGSEGQSSLSSPLLPWKFSCSNSISRLRRWSCSERARRGHGHPLPPALCPLPIQGCRGSGTAPRQALLTAQVMGRKEHILSTR